MLYKTRLTCRECGCCIQSYYKNIHIYTTLSLNVYIYKFTYIDHCSLVDIFNEIYSENALYIILHCSLLDIFSEMYSENTLYIIS